MKPGLLQTWPLNYYADRTAIVFGDQRLSYREIDARINRLSHGLMSVGLKKGQKVAVLLNNSLESVECLLGISRAGLVFVPLNARHAAQEHEYILNDAEVDAIILGEEFVDLIDPILPPSESVKHVILVGDSQSGKMDYESLVKGQPDTEPDLEIDEDDIDRIQYTSGTTGRPKGVVSTFRISYNRMNSALINLDQPILPTDVNLNIGPLTHAAGFMMAIYYIHGTTNVVLPRFDLEEVLRTIERESVTSVLLIPTMLVRILMLPNLRSYDLSSIRRIWYGTAPMPAERLKEAIAVFGNVFRQNYGMTESPQPITYLRSEDHIVEGTEEQVRRLSSAGKPALGVELKVVTEDGIPVVPGQVGEILIRTDKLMKEYWKMPEATAEAFRGGWFHTGDMATVDAEGYIYIMDRKNDMIISGGFNIYPREVEEVIMAHPGVAEAAVIGVPDDIWGESVRAFVVPREGITLVGEEIVQFCKDHLASYKKPKNVQFVAEIPKNLYGKIDRRALKEPFWSGLSRRVH